MAVFWKHIFNLVAFVSLALIGIALVLAKIFSGNVAGAFMLIANILAYVVIIFYSGVYVFRGRGKWGKRRIIECIIWAVAAVLVVVFVILNKDLFL